MIKGAGGRYRRATPSEVRDAAARYAAPRLVGNALVNPAATRAFVGQRLAGREAEVFCALWLNNRHAVIEFDELFIGTVDGTSVHPREVVKRCLAMNAAAVIFAHNHPSGLADPSKADELITARLKDALALVDVRVLDHLVVGNEVVSFAERGLL
jgi:DNA repair protein RadC